MILSPEVYNRITAVVFTRQEPPVTTVFWAKPSDPEGLGFEFFVFDNGAWQSLADYENVIIPEVDPYLSAFINDVGFYTLPTGGIPLSDLADAVQTSLGKADNAVLYSSQTLTSEQQAQARQNIGAQDVINSSHKLSADLVSDGSTNKVFTSTEQSKLSGIASGAEVNVQANWNETDTSSDAYIQNKPTTSYVTFRVWSTT